MKTIWIINEYAGAPEYGMTYRHYYLAKEFVKMGNPTTIITASYSHFLRKTPRMNGKKYKVEKIGTVDYLWIDVIHYTRSFDKKRVLKWFQFMFCLFFIGRYINTKPDVIICSPTAPFSIIPAYYLAKKYKAKLIFEVRDIWPLTLIEVGKISPKHPFIKLMGWFEHFALTRSDAIVSNLVNYGEHMRNRGINRDFHWISNGIDLDELNAIEPLDVSVKEMIPKNKFIVGYTGTVGLANSIDSFLESANYLKSYEKILLVVVGDGQEKDKLQQKFGQNTQIVFVPAIPKKQVPSILRLFDVCFIGLKNEKLFRYGVSPNKLYDYMYSAKPVLYAIESQNNIIVAAKSGIVVEAENPKAIAEGISKLYNMSQKQRIVMGQNGYKYVLEHFTYKKLAEKFLKVIGK
jgi:glycosyltransferase involved in cell wall biosynthesis